MKFSIIIPVYNVADYIIQCVDSVIKQTYDNYEIILIDDGSTDNSGYICDQLKEQHYQINVHHKKNGGLSSARNKGILLAKGDYLLFLDSDDYWDDINALKKIADILEKQKYDVLNFHYKKFYDKSQKLIHSFINVNIDEFLKVPIEKRKFYLVKYSQFIASACNKVVKKELFNKYNLMFDKGKTSEDIYWCARLLLYSENMGICNETFYVYRQRDSSITHTVQLKNLIDLKENIQNCLNMKEIKNLNYNDRIAYYNYISYIYCTSLLCYQNVKDDRKKEFIHTFKQNTFLLNYHQNKKVFCFYIINKLIGFNGLMCIIKLYTLRKKV